jgi:hypothetical protein
MKARIFSFIPAKDTSMVASTKVARFVSDTLEIPLIWDASIGDFTNLDALIIVNGAYAFCGNLEPLSHAIIGANKIVWIQQDYSIVPPINNGQATSPFRRAFVMRKEQGKSHLEYWTTCAKESKLTKLSAYVNWNCLSMHEKPFKKPYMNHNDLVYYGSFRAGRKKYFDTYFKNPKYQVTISSPNKKFEKEYMSPMIKHVGPETENLVQWLSQHGMGLYLEDKKSHSDYHSPPNRFYEMLSAGLPIVFQQEAGPTLRQAGYIDIDRYTVGKPLDIQRKMDSRELIAKEQQDKWFGHAVAERQNLQSAVKEAWRKLGGR